MARARKVAGTKITAPASARTRERKNVRGRPAANWKPRFIAAFHEHWTITKACEVAGVSRTTAYRERQFDEDFALAWADTDAHVTDAIESAGVALALSGDARMIEFFLKARRPGAYRENVRVQHSGEVRHLTRTALGSINPVDLSPEEREALAVLAEGERARASARGE